MTLPKGYRFRPTDQELLLKYLEKKCSNEALPCDVVIDREIYGDKAPWQNFTDEDPWEISKTKDMKTDLWKTEGTIYVFTTLIKASQNRIARKAGCGSWHGETAREEVKNGKCAIGYKTTLYFEIAADEPIAMEGPVEKGHWIMQGYSLRNGNTDKSTGKYVLCRIKRFDSKYTKVSPRKRKNVEAATTENDLVVSKLAKCVRTEVMQEKKLECDIIAAPDTEVVTISKDQQFVQDQSFLMSDDANELTVEELEAIWEQEEQGSYSRWHCDNSALVPLDSNTVTSNTYFHMPATYLDKSVLVVEQQQGFGLDCNAFGNISSTPKHDWVQYSNPSHIGAQNLSNTEAWLSAELLPSDQESEGFLFPNSTFHATIEPSPIFSFSNDLFLDQQKNNMSEHLPSIWW
ncbi:NAC domain-containing protein 1-like [Rhododendron vialii]|uniref:NAC domain-containing protein 1-like n=1 Tax=Rhododendron vialii TaxID=182163 RepID=UPI00265ED1A6|nr:NAC domain-containing protein 1-like [Rhododendron vialii]